MYFAIDKKCNYDKITINIQDIHGNYLLFVIKDFIILGGYYEFIAHIMFYYT